MDDFIGELLDRIDASGQNFSQSAYQALSQDLEPLLRLLFVLAVLFYGVQLFLGTSRLSVAEIIGRLVRVFVILILVGTWSNFNDLVYDWLTTVPEAAGRAILAASGTGVTEPTNGLSQIWKTANTAAAAFSEQAGYLSVLPALIGIVIMLFAGIFVAIALGILVLAKVILWVLLGTAPIFISCFFFDSTRNYAVGWLNQSLLYAMIPLFVYVIAAFLGSLALSPSVAQDGPLPIRHLTLDEMQFADKALGVKFRRLHLAAERLARQGWDRRSYQTFPNRDAAGVAYAHWCTFLEDGMVPINYGGPLIDLDGRVMGLLSPLSPDDQSD